MSPVFFSAPATTEIYTLSLHDALPICARRKGAYDLFRARLQVCFVQIGPQPQFIQQLQFERDRKSTRLNSSHSQISYAVFCLKKKRSSSARNARPRRDHYSSSSQPCVY